MPTSTELAEGQVIDNFQVVSMLGSGGMGAVYEVICGGDKQLRGAMKVEPIDAEFPVSLMELSVLRRVQGIRQFCTLLGEGQSVGLTYVVMTKLGKSLQDIRQMRVKKKFSATKMALIGLSCLSALKSLHQAGFLHRDIKPANFAVGIGADADVIHLLDFGICRRWVDGRGNVQKPRSPAPFRGTTRYASIATHEQLEQRRTDDIWSFFYMLVEMIKGKLLWNDFGSLDTTRVYNWKKRILPRFMVGADGPIELLYIHTYLETLGYLDDPDYDYIAKCLQLILKRQGVTIPQQLS